VPLVAVAVSGRLRESASAIADQRHRLGVVEKLEARPVRARADAATVNYFGHLLPSDRHPAASTPGQRAGDAI